MVTVETGLQHRVWVCEAGREGLEPRRQPGVLRNQPLGVRLSRLQSWGQESAVWTSTGTGDGPIAGPALPSAGYGMLIIFSACWPLCEIEIKKKQTRLLPLFLPYLVVVKMYPFY